MRNEKTSRNDPKTSIRQLIENHEYRPFVAEGTGDECGKGNEATDKYPASNAWPTTIPGAYCMNN